MEFMQICLLPKGVGILIRKDNQKKITLWTMLVRIFPQVVSVSPGIFFFNSIIFAFDGASSSISVIFMQRLFDRVTDLATGIGVLDDAIIALVLFFLIKLLRQVISGVDNFIGETYDPKVYGRICLIVNEKMAKLDPLCFENTMILDDINKSYTGIRYAINFINTIMDVISFYIPYFIFMGMYLFKLKPVLILTLLMVFIPTLFSQFIRVKVFAKLEDISAPLRRKAQYYEECLVSKNYLKETRLLGACPYFLQLFKETLTQMNQMKLKADVKTNLIELSVKIVSLAGYFGILWILFDALMKQEITVGAFAAVFASIDSLFSVMEEVICGRLGYYAKNFGKVQNYLRFLDLPERGKDVETYENTIHGDIVLEDVSFSYPLSEHNAIENINLTIHSGETVALVGENGSGKSTLIRLLTGLYLPQSGNVSHNNKYTNELAPTELFAGTSGIFQKYQRYKLSLSNNINISDLYSESKTLEDVKDALTQVRVKVSLDTFPNKLDTVLSREFDGVDLSGGLWQKIAIARGFYRDHELIILDEPTAAIDPIEETKIYEQFAEISRGKTAVIVTHRLGSVKFANRIIVMEGGRIVGEGNHAQLLKDCSLYKNMWNSQAQHYVSSDDL